MRCMCQEVSSYQVCTWCVVVDITNSCPKLLSSVVGTVNVDKTLTIGSNYLEARGREF